MLTGTSLEVQWSSIPGRGTKILYMPWGSKNQSIKQKKYYNKFNKDFKNGPHKKIF